jgi:hypothetical protein
VKLHSSDFEKRLKRNVRRTVRQSKELRKLARQSNRPRHYSLGLLVRPGLSVLLAALTWWVAGRGSGFATTIAVINLWMFLWLCTRVRGLLACLYFHPDLNALSFLPIEVNAVFRWQLQKFFRAALMSLVDLIAALGVVGVFYEFTPAKWLITALIALLAWSTFLGATLLCAARWPRLPYGIFPGLGILAGFVFLFGREFIGKFVIEFLNWGGPTMNLLLPTGWPLSLLQLLTSSTPEPLLFVLLLPIGGILWTIKDSLARLRANYEFTEIVTEPPSDLLPAETSEPASVPDTNNASETPRHLGITAIEEIILSRQFLSAPKWHEVGRLERLLWNSLTPRERTLAEFAFLEGLSITKAWQKIFRNALIAIFVAFVAGFVSPDLRVWILILGGFITFCQALAKILSTGRAFQPELCSGVNIPLYATYAIGFRELARFGFKHSLAQAPLFIPFIVMLAAAIAYFTKMSLWLGTLIGLEVSILLLALRFISLTFAFSSGTNDSSKITFNCLLLLFALALFGFPFLGFGAASIIVLTTTQLTAPIMLLSGGLLSLAILCAYGVFRVYGWFYHGNRFDLMTIATQQN